MASNNSDAGAHGAIKRSNQYACSGGSSTSKRQSAENAYSNVLLGAEVAECLRHLNIAVSSEEVTDE